MVEEPEEITLKFKGGEIVYAASTKESQLTAGGRVEPCRGGGNCPVNSAKYCYYYFVNAVERCAPLT